MASLCLSPSSSSSSSSSTASCASSSYGSPHMHPTRPTRPSAGTPAIASLPSFAHSLSSFPTMTAVTNDMVHYGSGRAKRASEAKLNTVLRRTQRRQDTGYPDSPARDCSHSVPSLEPRAPCGAAPAQGEDDDAIVVATRKRKVN
ncbi:hypothetical protein SCP_0706450 [Sparassis crispa]|uniref:Uncharacterized protein n=1 Tax=Sparassis crispa TaxID=139825 RepID=A0A401GTA0_9APHY|nr:hypothetical protein SCP_0706450 [Sparassis crispa]GBE85458.1 hypothetical protein SCP_0706450 [Sparassis crispa]